MLLEAARDFQIDLAQSFMIGDTTADIEAGRRASCTTILVRTGKAGREEDALVVEPSYDVANLYEAAVKVRELLSEK
jgi:phosphoglycolate phosphatase-like HAD superfamily hydrolase